MSIYYFPPATHLSHSAETLLRTVIEEGPYDDDLMDPDIFWWIAELLERRGAMAEDLIPGLDAKAVLSYWDDSYYQVPAGPLMASEAPEPIINPNAEHATGNKTSPTAPQDKGHKAHKKTDHGFNIHGPFNDQTKKA